jgi:hypothetical protein
MLCHTWNLISLRLLRLGLIELSLSADVGRAVRAGVASPSRGETKPRSEHTYLPTMRYNIGLFLGFSERNVLGASLAVVALLGPWKQRHSERIVVFVLSVVLPRIRAFNSCGSKPAWPRELRSSPFFLPFSPPCPPRRSPSVTTARPSNPRKETCRPSRKPSDDWFNPAQHRPRERTPALHRPTPAPSPVRGPKPPSVTHVLHLFLCSRPHLALQSGVLEGKGARFARAKRHQMEEDLCPPPRVCLGD